MKVVWICNKLYDCDEKCNIGSWSLSDLIIKIKNVIMLKNHFIYAQSLTSNIYVRMYNLQYLASPSNPPVNTPNYLHAM